MNTSLLPFVVLYHPPQSKQMAVQPMAASNANDALAMAGAVLVEQGLKDAVIIGVLDEGSVGLLHDVMGQLKAVCLAHKQ